MNPPRKPQPNNTQFLLQANTRHIHERTYKMDIKGYTVRHRVFGKGKITDLTPKVVSVCFGDTEKRFVYPDAFADFLTLGDRKAEDYVKKQIAETEAAKQAKKRELQDEIERIHKLLNFKLSSDSHAVFDIPATAVEETLGSYTVSTGTNTTGYKKGLPKSASKMAPNSVCILTTRPAGQPEQERRIIGLFMVKEDFFGQEHTDGIIEGHAEYRLSIPKQKRPLFWEQTKSGKKPCWGNTAFKYCSVETADRILLKLTETFKNTLNRDRIEALCTYFRAMNRLPPPANPI